MPFPVEYSADADDDDDDARLCICFISSPPVGHYVTLPGVCPPIYSGNFQLPSHPIPSHTIPTLHSSLLLLLLLLLPCPEHLPYVYTSLYPDTTPTGGTVGTSSIYPTPTLALPYFAFTVLYMPCHASLLAICTVPPMLCLPCPTHLPRS